MKAPLWGFYFWQAEFIQRPLGRRIQCVIFQKDLDPSRSLPQRRLGFRMTHWAVYGLRKKAPVWGLYFW